MNQDAGLDRRGAVLCLWNLDELPGLSVIRAAFEMDLPDRACFLAFPAAAAQEGAVGQLDGFVFDGPKNGFREAGRFTPRLSIVDALARPATIPRARAAETERKAISYHLQACLPLPKVP